MLEGVRYQNVLHAFRSGDNKLLELLYYQVHLVLQWKMKNKYKDYFNIGRCYEILNNLK